MTEVPDLDVNQVREDFEAIWQKNTVTAILQVKTETEAGNYGYDDENDEGITTSLITVNIQGLTSQAYQMKLQGLIRAGATFHAYVKYDVTLENDDRILWDGIIFVVKNWNDSMYAGQRVFREFDLVVVDFY